MNEYEQPLAHDAHFDGRPDLLPSARFSDPLFVRVFCEATNPDREGG